MASKSNVAGRSLAGVATAILGLCLLLPSSSKADTPTPINYPLSDQTLPLAINNKGDVVGYYYLGGGPHAFLFSAGKYFSFDFRLCCGPAAGTVFTGINDAGQITGFHFDDPLFPFHHGLRLTWSTGELAPIEDDGANETNPRAINDAGDIVGDASLNHNGFLYSGGIFSPID